MRLLTYSRVDNIRNNHLLQCDSSDVGVNAHKVIFGYYDPYANQDICDWAFSHIGVPYARRDGQTKAPYEKIDCAGLVTATKIQAMGSENNATFNIGNMSSYT